MKKIEYGPNPLFSFADQRWINSRATTDSGDSKEKPEVKPELGGGKKEPEGRRRYIVEGETRYY